MKLDLSNLSYDAKWYDFETEQKVDDQDLAPDKVYFKIQPLPFSRTNILLHDGDLLLTGKDQYRIFNDSLIDWKNVTDANGQALKCDEKTKKLVYDFRLAGISTFVLRIVWGQDKERVVDEKN